MARAEARMPEPEPIEVRLWLTFKEAKALGRSLEAIHPRWTSNGAVLAVKEALVEILDSCSGTWRGEP